MKYLCLILVLAAQLAAGATIPARSISVDTNTVAFSSDRLQSVLDYLGTQVFAWTNPTNGITQAAGDLRWMGIANYDGVTIGTNASGQLMWMNPENSVGTAQITNGAVTFPKLACVSTNVADGTTNEVPTVKAVKDYTDAAQASAVALAQGFVNLAIETNYFMAQFQQTNSAAVESFVANVWTQRQFNVVATNTTADAISLSNNTFVLTNGTYYTRIRCPSYGAGIHAAILFNRTENVPILFGSIEQSVASCSTDSKIAGRFVLSTACTVAVDHIASATPTFGTIGTWTSQTNVIGIYTNIYPAITNTYSQVEFWKIK